MSKITIVASNEIIAAIDMKISTVWLSKMIFFLAISKSFNRFLYVQFS